MAGSYTTALRQKLRVEKTPVIPDIKSKSPGEGDLLSGRDPVAFAVELVAAGAPALSVVTEAEHFGGSPELFSRISHAVTVPVLRKDFITTVEQVQESVDMGAAAVLLIAAMMEKSVLFKLFEKALSLGLEPLVETHNEAEIRIANELKPTFLGINNRNILELEKDGGNVSRTENLAALAWPEALIVSESSISSPCDVRRAAAAGAHAVLVGTAILRADDPAAMYRKLSELKEQQA
ncbi:MAG: indole-3-glycerol-phosphate synthase [Armatimonadota bacterium]